MSELHYQVLVHDGLRRHREQRLPDGSPIISSPVASTLIYGERDAVLVDPPFTREQVNRNPRLRNLVIDKIDRRYKPPRPYQAIECEAVGQVALERMLRARLDALLPEPLADVLVREEQQRTKIRRALARIARSAS